MKTYDVLKRLNKEEFDKLVSAGVMSFNIERDVAVYEAFCYLRSQNVPIMLSYEELASMYFTDSENIRKIVAKLGR